MSENIIPKHKLEKMSTKRLLALFKTVRQKKIAARNPYWYDETEAEKQARLDITLYFYSIKSILDKREHIPRKK